jgi:hypothetical protein
MKKGIKKFEGSRGECGGSFIVACSYLILNVREVAGNRHIKQHATQTCTEINKKFKNKCADEQINKKKQNYKSQPMTWTKKDAPISGRNAMSSASTS